MEALYLIITKVDSKNYSLGGLPIFFTKEVDTDSNIYKTLDKPKKISRSGF